MDGQYHVTGGVERLALEWRAMRGRWIDERAGIPQEPLDPELEELLKRAGSATFKQRRIKDMDTFEFNRLSKDLAPIESDGKDDTDEWNMFEEYLNTNENSLRHRHDLSRILTRWEHDVVSVITYLL